MNSRKDWFIINQIETNYTGEMEKAMYQSYGFGYEEYNRNLNNRMKVEAERERNYRRSVEIVASHQNQVRP
ncbi:hypothetical protein [Texcoconibacillus texcoconensis]|uniref:Uncharacterized protein n=1 Tax=Texcoconibacillus texcoconensis TaxID=1095777 RepID=A0A840QQD6_9BACI|nr:hypothetical protein [Texcoconibacillus texcoconensis]MBB5173517.1 hypothetical protein [Texcoconibacillus texcoconensis]